MRTKTVFIALLVIFLLPSGKILGQMNINGGNPYMPQPLAMLDFPEEAYSQNSALDFSIEFITPRTLRIKMLTTPVKPASSESLMLAGPLPQNQNAWKYKKTANGHSYQSGYGHYYQLNKGTINNVNYLISKCFK